MQSLVNPPIGMAAVRAFYQPVHLIEIRIPVGQRIVTTECHVKAAPNIQAFFDVAHERGLSGLIHSFDGIYNPRPKRLSNQPSMHSYGAAFDINASTNNQGDDEGNMPHELVEIGESLGFFWGGNFRGKFVDKMHFQFGTDFALNGRPQPRVTYQPGSTPPAVIAAHPPADNAPPAPKFSAVRAVKVFDPATGEMTAMNESAGLITTDGRAVIQATALEALLKIPIGVKIESGVIQLKVSPPHVKG